MAKKSKRKPVEWWGIWRRESKTWMPAGQVFVQKAVVAFPSRQLACQCATLYCRVNTYAAAKEWCEVLPLSKGEPEKKAKRKARRP